MTAKEMFKKLGYKQEVSGLGIEYINDRDEGISFWEDETLSIFAEYSYEDKCLTKDELRAIMAQAKELGWLDE